MTEEMIQKQRQQNVIKANELIQKARYNLTVRQQKILLYLISRIDTRDLKGKKYKSSLNEIAEVCHINIEGGTGWNGIDTDLLRLTKREETAVVIPGKRCSISWLGDYIRDENTGELIYWFNENMEQFLFDIHEQYTKYRLQDILVFNCQYSIRLYEYIRSFAGQHRLESDIEPDEYRGPGIAFNMVTITVTEPEFRERMECVDIYKTWKELNRSVIKKAVDEINSNNTDIHIEYKARKHKGQDKVIVFAVISKEAGKTIEERHKLNREWVDAYNSINDRLETGKHIGKRQTSI